MWITVSTEILLFSMSAGRWQVRFFWTDKNCKMYHIFEIQIFPFVNLWIFFQSFSYCGQDMDSILHINIGYLILPLRTKLLYEFLLPYCWNKVHTLLPFTLIDVKIWGYFSSVKMFIQVTCWSLQVWVNMFRSAWHYFAIPTLSSLYHILSYKWIDVFGCMHLGTWK